MTRRTRIGANFGTFGYFLSQAGDDVAAPTKSLLVDSRFNTLDIHVQGQFTLSRYDVPTPNNDTIWYGQQTFPPLGYRPLFFGSIIYATANNVGIPANSAYFPSSWFLLDGPGLGSTMAGPDLSTSPENLDASGVWLGADNASICAKATWLLSNTATLRCSYTVFKNPMESG
jgi:hypothetical protein